MPAAMRAFFKINFNLRPQKSSFETLSENGHFHLSAMLQ